MKQLLFITFSFLIFCISKNAYAYIDPGSGGYLITAILTTVGGFLAFCSAVVIHFFRHTLKNAIVSGWKNHRLFFILCILPILLLALSIPFYFLNQSPEEGGLVLDQETEIVQLNP